MNFYKKAVAGATPENAAKPFGMRDKLAYAAGDLGCNMSFALSGTYLAKFWTEYMGFADPSLPAAEYTLKTAAIWSIIIILVKIWDAINDPIIGGLVDKIKAKPGQSKFKPWIFWGSFLLLFGGAVCFIPVPTAPVWVKIALCIVGYLIWDMSYTLVNVPYGSLNSVISTNSEERAQLSTWRSIGSFVGNIALSIAIPMFVYDNAGAIKGQLLIWVGLIAGIVAVVCFQLLCRGTTERVVVNYEEQKQVANSNYFKSLGKFFTNRAAVSYTVYSIFQLLAMAFMQNYVVYYFQAAFPEYTSLSGIFSFLGMLPMFLIIPFATKIVRRFGKKEASTWPNLLGILSGLILILIPMETMSPILGILIFTLSSVFMGLAISVNSLVGWAMVADCIDYQELRTGVREEGVVYATYSLGRKLAQGVGAGLVTALLVLTAFNLKAGKNVELNNLLAEQKNEAGEVVKAQGYVDQHLFVYTAEEDMTLSFTATANKDKEVINNLVFIEVDYLQVDEEGNEIEGAYKDFVLTFGANGNYKNGNDYVDLSRATITDEATGSSVTGRYITIELQKGAKLTVIGTAGKTSYTVAEIQHASVAPKVRLVLGLVYAVCFVIQFALLHFVYNLDKKTLAEIEEKLGRNNDNLIGEQLDED